ncbi:hypothetical protein M441DRAFT_328938 [Trichoderma asperellum CBS 433.97]|uniref:Uncharacterized protein n=1 Tax=Trichoderma asperellum (strain ATCC 204424 / CBS 433.97 / NBRC 101777) TaxID=1042311 RepID=A0A2T3YSF0_TRIA4|nr:hypothetical protein M441DRAFT_328938 [Trichoderma asperellum CBS 433.97]PTB35501.1 hypothetical protein M441DRAFT_328938 [Trichoderma asperellum CBS 433.97]
MWVCRGFDPESQGLIFPLCGAQANPQLTPNQRPFDSCLGQRCTGCMNRAGSKGKPRKSGQAWMQEEGKMKGTRKTSGPCLLGSLREDPLTASFFPAAPPQRLTCMCLEIRMRCQPICSQYQELCLVLVSATVRLHKCTLDMCAVVTLLAACSSHRLSDAWFRTRSLCSESRRGGSQRGRARAT